MQSSRQTQRLTGFDYAQDGFYFVTVCVHRWWKCLGEVEDGILVLNKWGDAVQEVWRGLPRHYDHCRLDEFVVMPDHIHGIIEIKKPVGAGLKPAHRHGLSEIVRAFKTFSSRKINQMTCANRFQWQRGFHDRIVRNERELNILRQYVAQNPINWPNDELNTT